jgi:hypothetical protein
MAERRRRRPGPCGTPKGLKPRHCWHHTATDTRRRIQRGAPGLYSKQKIDTCCHCGTKRRRAETLAGPAAHGPFVEIL